MAADPRQERIGATVLSLGATVVAGLEWLDRPQPGEFVETGPDWYVAFNVALHGAILLLLLIALARLTHIVADRPDLRALFLGLILVGTLAAAYLVGRDLGLV
ncbi:MAG: hypothetical protein U1E69_19390 [Tabrizicola sp.]|uniref:hypothetical protein n=1 Tax=Tabrizicola sp. TaxID=2005166 RepID=UPI002ABC51C8|nr:hypothetical protein [Tabrizicola sp.]MDZ4088961.1 hypothetical protein [Tabrizicola sp.]